MAKLSSHHLTLLALALFFRSSLAHSSNGMDSSMDGPMSLAQGNMLPYLHFTPGDTLWFQGWVPASGGAMFGTCIALVFLAVVERWLAGVRRCVEVGWRLRAKRALEAKVGLPTKSGSRSPSSVDEKAVDEQDSSTSPSPSSPSLPSLRNRYRVSFSPRTIPPFIPSVDISRGVLQAVQSVFGYLFMLAVMTFQVGFILSIVVGLGIGECLFGRWGVGL
ncbi:hypothetical protein JAAARDRAFT_42889 [Jaapia argillacea MUCL 33604]|uniref:Copper transport protein n=1 Tax=Jaapia argillacea MUCL 33604 TaxID=933084 RepID=A0A067PEP3_9AGAM|nr:hypothetical protein JAAARDRAFT_42889 [Jaapia argillacea MUCL 33604]